MPNMDIYDKVKDCPKTALKEIAAGRLKGKSDINPMWRIKMLTELFGACGIGWYYEIDKQWLETGAAGEISAFCNISLYIRQGEEWSKPIQGTGGASYIAREKNGMYTSDECYKMALTDAISVACKALGFAADVYWAADKTKYDQPRENPPQFETRTITAATIKAIDDMITATGTDRAKLLEYYHVSRIDEMTPDQAKHCVATLKKRQNG